MARRQRSVRAAARRPQGRGFWPLPGLLIVGTVAIVAVLGLIWLNRPGAPVAGGPRDNALGPATAAVTVEEWGDFQ